MAAALQKMAAVDRAIANEGTKIMLLMRLSGFLPYLLTTFCGIIPGTFAFTWAGAAGIEALRGRGHHAGLIVTAVGAVLVILFVGRIAANAIRRAGIEQ